jgi:putative DNA primase/helicase
VLIVEGEKAADAAQKLFPDCVAITSPGGSGAAGKTDWRPLKDRRVAIWPDHDKPGARYAKDVTRLAVEVGAAQVAVVDVLGAFPDGWDLADEAPDGWNVDQLRDLLDAAMSIEAETETDAPDSEVETILAELAALPPIEYERRREDAAKEMKFRVSVLDAEVAKRRPPDADDAANAAALFADPEPWQDAVNGATLLDALAGAFMRYAVLPEGAAAVLALWVVHAHAHDAANISPILGLISPEKRCGKTTTLSIIQSLVPRALPAANITAAALFRVVEKWQPTVLIDEADTFLRDNDELRGVLNSGHNRAAAFVVRTVGDDHEAKPFRTWAPKAIALIGNLPDTLADRSIPVRLRRKRRDETVERLRLDRMEGLAVVARQAARWAADNLDGLRETDPDVSAELHDRAADNWRPLLAIADHAGGEWPERARQVAKLLSGGGEDDEGSAGVMLLADIRSIFAERRVDRITSADLVETLVTMESRPWPEWRRGKPITVRQVARLLKPFGVSPHVIRTGAGTPRGYNLGAFSDAFSRYLPSPSATPQQTNEINALSRIPSATSTPNVADRKSDKPLKNNECCGVADENPPPGGKGDKGHENWRAEV